MINEIVTEEMIAIDNKKLFIGSEKLALLPVKLLIKVVITSDDESINKRLAIMFNNTISMILEIAKQIRWIGFIELPPREALPMTSIPKAIIISNTRDIKRKVIIETR